MSGFKKIWKLRRFKVWFILTTFITILVVTVNLVLTQHAFVNNTLNIVFGGSERQLLKGDPTKYQYYKSDYDSKKLTYKAGNELNELINEEGIVLLKNNDNVLPLLGKNISVFGKNSTNLVYGGSGSGGGNFDGATTLYDSLDAAGFNVNPVLKDFYKSSDSGSGRAGNPAIENGGVTGFATGETPQSAYTQSVTNSYSEYQDAAIVVISRIGGEGFDLPRTMEKSNGDTIDGAASPDDHYLELDQDEQDLLQAVSDAFDKVVLVINSSAVMELGFLDDINDNDDTMNNYDYASGIDAALWIGGPGYSGSMAIGKVLNGTVNPSGRTVDTYARDFSQDPTWLNFANNFSDHGNRYTQDGKTKPYFFVDYEEGIYVGYRYYETRGVTDGEQWYEDNVVYPFGYGLSYTSFDWNVISTTPTDSSQLNASSEISITVKVTNTGSVAGKEVVQAYVTAPYINSEIEKSSVVLMGFEKTGMIEPGESDTVTVTFNAYDMASYDFADLNNNGFKGFELDGGNYEIKLSRNAHEVIETVNYTVPTNGFKYLTDPETNYSVVNRFDDVSAGLTSTLSRSDWSGTWPTTPTDADREISDELIDAIKSTDSGAPTQTVVPNQSNKELTSRQVSVKLYELIGKDYDDELWNDLLDNLTYDQMVELIGHAAFQTINIDAISLPKTTDADGPAGFVNFMGDPSINGTVTYASQALVGSTWNKELAEEMGRMIGNEGIWGNQAGDGTPYTGWYAPAINIHRTPFSGRNFEYYSEDGHLSGIMAAHVIKGAEEKGLITYVKHFVLNDQETRREINGLLTWADEQSMREIYFRAFEIAVKDGHASGMMSSFNRLGTTWAGGSYDLLTEVLRNEWGFEGAVITDFNLQKYMDPDQMVMAGGDLNLTQSKPPTSDYNDPTLTTALRKATHNILFATANSNAMNGQGDGVVWGYGLAPWMKLMFVIDGALVAVIGVSGFFVIKKGKRKLQEQQA